MAGLNPEDDVCALAERLDPARNEMLVGHLPFMEKLAALLAELRDIQVSQVVGDLARRALLDRNIVNCRHGAQLGNIADNVAFGLAVRYCFESEGHIAPVVRVGRGSGCNCADQVAGLDRVKPMQKWNFLAEKQANTLRAQLYFQIREYEKADECFDRCLIMDPLTLAMKMTRLHAKGNQAEIEKLFKKGVKQYKDEKGVILYALYSWILVQTNRIDDALALLSQAKDKTEDATLRTNWEHLANGRARHFSNAGLGDQWYALHLEEPKAVKTRGHIAGRWMR